MTQRFQLFAKGLVAICSILTMAGTQTLGQDSPACSVRDQKGNVAIVVCRPGLAKEQWRAAGVAACLHVKPCSAWIWDDPKKAPKSAPPAANLIPQADILTTVAIWDNDTNRLLMISKQK